MKDGNASANFPQSAFFINAGARPSVPNLEGLADVPFLDSTSIMELNAVPEHLLVLGGGYVGPGISGNCFGAWAAKVAVVQSAAQLFSPTKTRMSPKKLRPS